MRKNGPPIIHGYTPVTLLTGLDNAASFAYNGRTDSDLAGSGGPRAGKQHRRPEMNTVNPESERAASFKEAKILETVADLNVVLGLSGEITPLAGIELARACALMLMMAVKQDGAEEFFHNIVEECDAPHDTLALVVGHFVMQALGEARLDLTTLAAKQFLMAAGHIIGPDHLDALRKNVAFMIRVEGFQ